MQDSSATNHRTFLKQVAELSAFRIVPRHVLGRGFTAHSDQITIDFIGLGKQAAGLRGRFLQNDARVMAVCDGEVGHRTATVCNIGNIAYLLGRPLRWNPGTEQFDGDAEANKLLSRPVRTKWTA